MQVASQTMRNRRNRPTKSCRINDLTLNHRLDLGMGHELDLHERKLRRHRVTPPPRRALQGHYAHAFSMLCFLPAAPSDGETSSDLGHQRLTEQCGVGAWRAASVLVATRDDHVFSLASPMAFHRPGTRVSRSRTTPLRSQRASQRSACPGHRFGENLQLRARQVGQCTRGILSHRVFQIASSEVLSGPGLILPVR